MRSPSKLLIGVALAAMAIAGGAAFTAPGLATSASTTQFVGGTVGQSVHGAELSRIDYTFSDGPVNHIVDTITLTFKGDIDPYVSVTAVPNGTGSTITFAMVSSNPKVWSASPEGGLPDLANLSVTVGNANNDAPVTTTG